MTQAILEPIWQTCRTAALAFIAGFTRKTGFHTLEARVESLSFQSQAVIVGLTLSLLFGLSLFAAQFGGRPYRRLIPRHTRFDDENFSPELFALKRYGPTLLGTTRNRNNRED
jgi:hypothetical protein